MKSSTTIAKFIEMDLLGDGQSIAEGQALFSSRMLDSFHLVELLIFIEQTFQVKIRPSDISPQSIDSPESLGRLVDAKRSASNGGTTA